MQINHHWAPLNGFAFNQAVINNQMSDGELFSFDGRQTTTTTTSTEEGEKKTRLVMWSHRHRSFYKYFFFLFFFFDTFDVVLIPSIDMYIINLFCQQSTFKIWNNSSKRQKSKWKKMNRDLCIMSILIHVHRSNKHFGWKWNRIANLTSHIDSIILLPSLFLSLCLFWFSVVNHSHSKCQIREKEKNQANIFRTEE